MMVGGNGFVNNIMQMMNNPMIKSMMNSKNPQQFALNVIKNSPNANTEMGRNVIKMLENGNTKEIEQYGRNILNSQGIDPDELKNKMAKMVK